MTDRTEYKNNQIARYIACAQDGLEKGFDCETARKDAMSGLGRAYDYMRDFMNDAKRPVRPNWESDRAGYEAFEKKFDVPFSLAHVREKHYIAFETFGDIDQLKLIVALREQCKSATLVEKITKKSAAKKAIVTSTAFPVISEATRPMKEAAVQETIRLANAYVARTKTFLSKHNNNPYDAVPVIEKVSEYSSQYRTADAKQRSDYDLQNRKAELADASRQPLFQFVTRENREYAWSNEGADNYVKQQVRNTEAYYDAFVAKMVTKVPSATTATYTQPHGAVWSHSVLKITKADGSVENWETKIMINRSKYDLLFNQWRTRLL